MKLDETTINDMAKSLVCITPTDEIIALLEGEGYSNIGVYEFIAYCEKSL